jgi:hypothetical protein
MKGKEISCEDNRTKDINDKEASIRKGIFVVQDLLVKKFPGKRRFSMRACW